MKLTLDQKLIALSAMGLYGRSMGLGKPPTKELAARNKKLTDWFSQRQADGAILGGPRTMEQAHTTYHDICDAIIAAEEP